MENANLNPGQYLTFALNGQSYGVPIGAVREINRVSEITPVPQTPHYVAGVMNLRGKVIPVVNLRVKLGMSESAHTRSTCIIVMETEMGQIGAIVDAVLGVSDFSAAQLEPPPLADEGDRGNVIGVGKQESQVIILLDVSSCLATFTMPFERRAAA